MDFCRSALLVTSVSTALLVSACQPTTEGNQSTSVAENEPPITDVSHDTQQSGADDITADGNDLEDGNHTASDSHTSDGQMTDMLSDYTRSMTRMHDEMMVGMSYNDPDTAFAKGMLGHHRGAIDMAEIQLKYGKDAAMRQLAQQIITEQQAEIDVLNKWLASHPDAAKPKPNTNAMQQAYANSMDDLHGEMTLGIADPSPDMAFAQGMLPHHIGAVDMAKIQLKYGTDEEMLALAQEIIDNQQADIELMHNWIAALKVTSNAQDSKVEDATTDNKNAATLDNDTK